MSNKNFGQFTQESSPTTAQFVVGYDTAVSGGERRYAFSDVLGLFRTQVFSTANGILQADGAGNVTSTGLTYSGNTLSVPDAFVVSSAGSIGLTASGAGKNITLTTGTTGLAWVNNTGVATTSLLGLNGSTVTLRLDGAAGSTSAIHSNSYATNTVLSFRRANGTASVPTAVASGDQIGGFNMQGYSGTGSAYNSGAGVLAFAEENYDGTHAGTYMQFRTVAAGTTSFSEHLRLDGYGTLILNTNAVSRPAWDVSGTQLRVGALTTTDNSSSGTVATAVANSFAVPTFAASSSTTFTNAANLYIAGDVAAGTNVTLTNSYGLWNVGKTRLDGKTIVNIGNSTMTIGTNTLSDPAFIIDYTGGTPNRDFTINTGGVVRWVMRGDSTAESGSNAGTNFAIRAYDDSGNGIDNPLTIIRAANGLMTLTRPLSVTAGSITGGAGNMTITAGTGASRTLTLQTTTSGGTATNAVVFGATQSAAFNGPIIQKVSALTYASPTSVDVTLGNVYTVTTVNATGSVTFNASAGGTAGQSMTILITNDATSAKTITFGTNFLSTGTLTASAAGRHTSITFVSNGTSWFETGRAVLTA